MNCRGNIMRLYEKQETKRSKEIKQHYLQRMDDKAYEIGKNLGEILKDKIDYNGIELSIKFPRYGKRMSQLSFEDDERPSFKNILTFEIKPKHVPKIIDVKSYHMPHLIGTRYRSFLETPYSHRGIDREGFVFGIDREGFALMRGVKDAGFVQDDEKGEPWDKIVIDGFKATNDPLVTEIEFIAYTDEYKKELGLIE